MIFSKLDWSGDISLNIGKDDITIGYKDLKSEESKMLFNIITKSKLEVFKTEGKDTIILKGKGLNKAIQLFLEEQIHSLKRNEFMFVEYKDNRKEIVPQDKKLSEDEVKSILNIVKVPVKPRAGCGEDKVKVKKVLDLVGK